MNAKANPRTCIVSREEKHRDQLIRFVASPEGTVVPDLKQNLPGRGAWVALDHSLVELAVRKGLFKRAFQSDIAAPADLPEQVEHLLGERLFGALSMANKAGDILTGFTKVDNCVRNGEAAVVLHARDASDDGKRKLQSAIHATVSLGGPEAKLVSTLTHAQINGVLGGENIVHVAIRPGGNANRFLEHLSRLQRYRGEESSQDEKVETREAEDINVKQVDDET